MYRRRWVVLFALVMAGATGLFAFASRTETVEALPSSATLRLEVDVAERKLQVIEHGEVTWVYTVTVGSQAHPTPRGSHRISWIEWNPSWTPPNSEWARGRQPVGPGPSNPMGRVKLFFRQPAYYVHGTNAEHELGQAASHGCVRLRNEDVIELAKLVMEHGGQARPASWYQRVIDRFRDTRRVSLSTPVPVTIR
jgi:murein L,D-transpeptidase YcbB/YkuD